jgi:hypothetical protein
VRHVFFRSPMGEEEVKRRCRPSGLEALPSAQ